MSSVDISGLCIDHYLHWCVTLGTNRTGKTFEGYQTHTQTHTHERQQWQLLRLRLRRLNFSVAARCSFQSSRLPLSRYLSLTGSVSVTCCRSAHAFIEGGATFLCLLFSEANEQHVDCFMHCLTTTMFCIATHSTPVGIRPIHVWYSKINTAVSILTHCLTQFHLLDSKCRLMLNGLQNCHQYLLL